MGNSNCDFCGYDKRMCICKDKVSYVAQEGGDHYQADYQHWDWVIDCKIHYLPANCTKYVSRWKKKNGIVDLKKAMTYIDKMIATLKDRPTYTFNPPSAYTTGVCTDRLIETLKLNGLERSIIEILSGPCHIRMLELAKENLDKLIRNAQRTQEAQADAAGMVTPAAQTSASLDQKTGLPGRAGGTTTQALASNASTELAYKTFGACPCGCGRPRRKNMDFASDDCIDSRTIEGMKNPFGYNEDGEKNERNQCREN